MQDILKKLIMEGGREDVYSREVGLIVYLDGLPDDQYHTYPDEVSVVYRIELDWRSWGIKDINVALVDELEFEVEITDLDGNVIDTLSIKVNPNNIKLDWVAGHSYVPESLEVTVDKTGKVLDAKLNIYYINKD